jgi:hypothetical protein
MNLYWSVYKNLEKEILELSNQIHIDDKQLSVYSVKIAELLIRCVIEIESISKDLFFREGGKKIQNRDLFFDTDCLSLLEKKWLLSKKKIIISAYNFHFEKEENRVLTPLHKANKRGTSSSDWKKAYQAVKHDRNRELKKGNIKHLIRALGALFILNIYYKDEVYDLEEDSKATNFPINLGSDIFSIQLHKWSGYDGEYNYLKKENFNECIYLTKFTNDSLQMNKESLKEINKKQIELFIKHPKFIKYIQTNNIKDYKGNNIMWDILGKDDYIEIIKKSTQNTNLNKLIKGIKYEAVLNKNDI